MQPFRISKDNKTLAERNEVQLTLTDTSHFLHSMLDHAKTGDTLIELETIAEQRVNQNQATLIASRKEA